MTLFSRHNIYFATILVCAVGGFGLLLSGLKYQTDVQWYGKYNYSTLNMLTRNKFHYDCTLSCNHNVCGNPENNYTNIESCQSFTNLYDSFDTTDCLGNPELCPIITTTLCDNGYYCCNNRSDVCTYAIPSCTASMNSCTVKTIDYDCNTECISFVNHLPCIATCTLKSSKETYFEYDLANNTSMVFVDDGDLMKIYLTKLNSSKLPIGYYLTDPNSFVTDGIVYPDAYVIMMYIFGGVVAISLAIMGIISYLNNKNRGTSYSGLQL